MNSDPSRETGTQVSASSRAATTTVPQRQRMARPSNGV